MREDSDSPNTRSVWDAEGEPSPGLDEDCSPTKNCRNMQGISFEGFAEPGMGLPDAWRTRLAREGKLDPAAESIRDLVLGRPE